MAFVSRAKMLPRPNKVVHNVSLFKGPLLTNEALLFGNVILKPSLVESVAKVRIVKTLVGLQPKDKLVVKAHIYPKHVLFALLSVLICTRDDDGNVEEFAVTILQVLLRGQVGIL